MQFIHMYPLCSMYQCAFVMAVWTEVTCFNCHGGVMQSDSLHHTMSVSENHVWHGVLMENIDTEYNHSILVIKRLCKLYGFDSAVDRVKTAAIAWFVSGGSGGAGYCTV